MSNIFQISTHTQIYLRGDLDSACVELLQECSPLLWNERFNVAVQGLQLHCQEREALHSHHPHWQPIYAFCWGCVYYWGYGGTRHLEKEWVGFCHFDSYDNTLEIKSGQTHTLRVDECCSYNRDCRKTYKTKILTLYKWHNNKFR